MWYFTSKLASHVTQCPRLPPSSPIRTSRPHVYKYAINVHFSSMAISFPFPEYHSLNKIFAQCVECSLLNFLGWFFKVGNSVSKPCGRRTSIEKPGQWPTYIKHEVATMLDWEPCKYHCREQQLISLNAKEITAWKRRLRRQTHLHAQIIFCTYQRFIVLGPGLPTIYFISCIRDLLPYFPSLISKK
jgi:hypothetical protein